jgi:formylglycine-generating enzyme required for sulfatase activity
MKKQKETPDAPYTFDIDMVLVKGGTFTMGCTSEQESDCNDDEKPTHQVTLDDFYIGKYEVTQAQWKEVMGSNPSYFVGDSLPVETVSWKDVQDFITKLNAKTGLNYRLPTEAEWEYAARGGAQSKGYKYSGSNNAGDVAWYYENSGDSALKGSNWSYDNLRKYNCISHPVGTKKANELGIYDMSGNVWEWCSDWYDDLYSSSAQTNPTGPTSGSYRVFRGGSWGSYYASYCRVSFRPDLPSRSYSGLGFRLARSSK